MNASANISRKNYDIQRDPITINQQVTVIFTMATDLIRQLKFDR